MRITVLVDNNTYIDHYYMGEPALSFYIEDEDVGILFDTGYSDVFMRNAQSLGVDLSKITKIILSHGHNDHTGGLAYFKDQFLSHTIQLIAHPDVFKDRFENGRPIGNPLSLIEIESAFKLLLSKDAISISKNLIFLGEIPSGIEERESIGIFKDGSPDYVMDDTALAYNTGKGLFIITGCSHSGICNIIEHAKRVCKENRIIGVIGGFHLFSVSSRLTQTITYFLENDIKELYPCHCVSFTAKAEMHKHIPIQEVGVGLIIDI